jgi:general secretion pathway protein G
MRRRNTAAGGGARQAGFSLLELIITLGIMAILVGAIIPITRHTVRREKEVELRRALREIRQAIDRYHYDCDTLKLYTERNLDRDAKEDQCYPKSLEILVEGIKPDNGPQASLVRKKYLRRIPKDPLTGKEEWGMRSVQDSPDSSSWGGQNVFDVFSQSDETPLSGKGKYKDW